ncbi:hypothetical protein BCR33DRAFT_754749 [Rhizoclosmatium globosum]|uniref:NEDD8-activating enzyme E1 catalytic subunit n=1 Tax=Rhizoclosmatium globosum TaxID=329046 RepID=A0A1Y2BRV5_9FUNG|nr:hypothetical protein BCR33DRAFT_754749 [Rhizoclosmatium globosum]|eukprot:ORY36865.1 hypothetical protein BCR33DRAFT_754749 [Rhizoclosmatium globosum]
MSEPSTGLKREHSESIESSGIEQVPSGKRSKGDQIASERIDWANRWRHSDVFVERGGPLAPESFEASEEVCCVGCLVDSVKILVVGAGGLGCELLKNLALLGFKDLHVIDMDTIDVSNLNRQFLFRYKDVGKSKAEVAAEFIMKRVPGCVVTPYYGKIQDKDEEYYSQFQIVICGLDSVEARRWINATILGLYDEEEGTGFIPIVDGGTEGFKGQSRVIVPKKTACYECSLDMQTKPICTIANTPRLPEHCIQFASLLQWPKEFPDKKIDGDDPDHISWLLDQATARANEFGIKGVTRTLTMGVVKNIIPAIASTNAIVAAATANEVFKIITSSAPSVDNYMMYTGDAGIYTHTFALEKNPNKISIPRSWKLSDLVDALLERQGTQLKKPSLRSTGKSLYMQSPKALEEATRPNLERLVIVVTDANLPLSLKLVVKFV